jgi:CheY-like chemotaxis protein
MKIVAVTGFAGSEHRAASRRAGFDAHVSKPFDPELVRSILETLLPDR